MEAKTNSLNSIRVPVASKRAGLPAKTASESITEQQQVGETQVTIWGTMVPRSFGTSRNVESVDISGCAEHVFTLLYHFCSYRNDNIEKHIMIVIQKQHKSFLITLNWNKNRAHFTQILHLVPRSNLWAFLFPLCPIGWHCYKNLMNISCSPVYSLHFHICSEINQVYI